MKKNYAFMEDESAVMERLGGNEALLGKLMSKFYATYRDTRAELLVRLEKNDYEEAHRIVHSIKGVSANLGIGKLYRLAIALESKMKAGEFDRITPDVLAFLLELDMVIAEMEKAGA
jgi:FOG: HPt domain